MSGSSTPCRQLRPSSRPEHLGQKSGPENSRIWCTLYFEVNVVQIQCSSTAIEDSASSQRVILNETTASGRETAFGHETLGRETALEH